MRHHQGSPWGDLLSGRPVSHEGWPEREVGRTALVHLL